MLDLSGKVAVVTGAASGIGRAMATTFVQRGMRVVVADRDHGRAVEVVSSLPGGTAIAVSVDVVDPASVELLRDTVLERFGAAHLLCNNAGIAHAGRILASTPADWRRVVDVNLLGVVHGVLTFGPLLVAQGNGHIVNTASMAGFLTGNDLASYDATKHAVVAFTENLYRELRSTGVGVSLLTPAYVDTELFAHATGDATTVRTFVDTTASWGISATVVAEAVLDAVLADQFWVFTHPDTADMTGIKSAYARAGLAPDDPFRAPT